MLALLSSKFLKCLKSIYSGDDILSKVFTDFPHAWHQRSEPRAWATSRRPPSGPARATRLHSRWAAEKRSRDPRFSALQGEVNKEGFRKRYSFLYDDVMAEEAAEARRAHRKARDPARKERMKRKVGHIEAEMRKEKDRRRSDKEKRAREEKLRDEVRQGKRPKYVSKSAVRREELVEKYEKLKDQGKLDDFMAKRRRKNAAKDHKFIPHRRVDR